MNDMKLQLALDSSNSQEAKRILKKVSDLVDIVEVGTPSAHERGGKGCHGDQKCTYPQLEVLADFKIMDAGDIEASIGFEAGCRYCDRAGAWRMMLQFAASVNQARTLNKQVMIDLIAVGDVRDAC